MRALVVDDSAVHRLTLAAALRELPTVSAVETASSGEEAIRLLARERFDLLSLDIQMPGIDGFAVLRWVMANHPLPVLVVSGAQHGPTALAALELGAFEVLRKPSPRSGGLETWKKMLARAVEAAGEIRVEKLGTRPEGGRGPGDAAGAFAIDPSERLPGVLAVASSTGGPAALRTLFGGLARRPVPVLVAQHMPPPFTRSLAARLAAVSGWDAREARDGEPLEPGTILVAPGGRHLAIQGDADRPVARLLEGGEARWCPSCDLLLASAARVFGARAVAVVLTGMGTDGADGARAVAASGGFVVAESRDTAVVAGMPDAAARAVPSALRLPLHAIADSLSRRFALATLPTPL